MPSSSPAQAPGDGPHRPDGIRLAPPLEMKGLRGSPRRSAGGGAGREIVAQNSAESGPRVPATSMPRPRTAAPGGPVPAAKLPPAPGVRAVLRRPGPVPHTRTARSATHPTQHRPGRSATGSIPVSRTSATTAPDAASRQTGPYSALSATPTTGPVRDVRGSRAGLALDGRDLLADAVQGQQQPGLQHAEVLQVGRQITHRSGPVRACTPIPGGQPAQLHPAEGAH